VRTERPRVTKNFSGHLYLLVPRWFQWRRVPQGYPSSRPAVMSGESLHSVATHSSAKMPVARIGEPHSSSVGNGMGGRVMATRRTSEEPVCLCPSLVQLNRSGSGLRSQPLGYLRDSVIPLAHARSYESTGARRRHELAGTAWWASAGWRSPLRGRETSVASDQKFVRAGGRVRSSAIRRLRGIFRNRLKPELRTQAMAARSRPGLRPAASRRRLSNAAARRGAAYLWPRVSSS
jgi:hypothetical protein